MRDSGFCIVLGRERPAKWLSSEYENTLTRPTNLMKLHSKKDGGRFYATRGEDDTSCGLRVLYAWQRLQSARVPKHESRSNRHLSAQSLRGDRVRLSRQSLIPKCRVSLGTHTVFATSMPPATVKENGDLCFREHNVRSSGQTIGANLQVLAKPEAPAVELAAQPYLRLGVCAPVALH